MDGVDHHDWLVCKYSIAIKEKNGTGPFGQDLLI
jgi:hypothetical protein